MARTKPADQRCDDLLDAAEAAFVEHGIPATTVTDITTRAGVAKGTFYLYFDSRAELVAAVQRRYGQRFIGRIADAVAAAGDDWGAKLDAIVAAGLADPRDDRRLHDALFAGQPSTRDHDDEQAGEVLSVVHDVLVGGVAAGAYRIADSADTATTAMLLLNALHGVYSRFWTGVAAPDDANVIASAQAIFRRSVGLPDADP